MPFTAGTSGNKFGRCKSVKSIRNEARRHASEAIQCLVSVLSDADAQSAAKVAAASKILDFAALSELDKDSLVRITS